MSPTTIHELVARKMSFFALAENHQHQQRGDALTPLWQINRCWGTPLAC
jgi:hypothetical protein